MANYSDIRYEVTGTDVYTAISDLPLSGVDTGTQAFVSGTNRLYMWTGTGWYNIALINTDPSLSGASSSYSLNIDGSNTVVTLASSDPEGLPISFSLSTSGLGVGANAIASVTQSNNIFTFTPTTNTALAGTFTATFTASDGVNLAVANSSFTLLFSVNNSNYTTALITSVGANLADNNDFVDSSTNSHTVTSYGNAHQATFSPYRHGGYSTYFDGSGDYLTIADNSTHTLTGDHTIEAFVNLTSYSASASTVVARWQASGTQEEFLLWITPTGVVHFYFKPYGTGTPLLSGGTVSLNSWTHIAVVRSGNDWALFVGGSRVATATNSSVYTDTTSTLTIGSLQTTYSQYDLTGYITDLRLVKGTAVYSPSSTTLSVPTERLTAVTNTSLLTCHLPYIADGSTNGHAITVNGNTKTQPFAPYDYATYSASNNGGSMYFDGSGDRLSIPDSTDFDFGSGDFTIDGWFMSTADAGSGGSSHTLISKWDNSSGQNDKGWFVRLEESSGDKLDFLYTLDGTNNQQLIGTTTISLNIWYHFAIVRNGTTLSMYLNGNLENSKTESGTLNAATIPLLVGDIYATGTPTSTTQSWTGYASDLRVVKGTAVYTSTFTPPTAPSTAITNTKLLLSGTNAGIIDKSQSVQSLTLNGDVKSSTTQTKYLSSSIYFDGTSDYITLNDVGDIFNFGTGQFTVECWLYQLTSGPMIIVDSRSSVAAVPWIFNINQSDKIQWYDGTPYVSTNTYNSVNTWRHIAVTRDSSNTLRIFKDGIVENTTSSYTANMTTHTSAIVGARMDGTAAFLNGYISDLRVTKGLARYTANFTPPTAALQG